LVSAKKEAKISQRAEMFFSVLDVMSREVRAARVAWRTHFDLLSDIDEMNQCKRSMRLAAKDEDFSKLTPEEQGSVVLAVDVAARYMEHGAKQAMTLGELRRNKDTLRYLRNQSRERHQENQCTVCLSPLDGECAVLACGHRFHYSPCFEKLLARNGSQSMIRCPFRCDTRTKRDEVLIATNKRKDDGSQIARSVKGSWGTKVTRLVADVMDVKDLGEKSIVFSQWEDMLEVVEHALAANEVKYVRAKSLTKLGDSVKAFRSSDCAVLLMNTKNGATGLTLVEATHVFMIEPLLNCGLDSQGRWNRLQYGFATAIYFVLDLTLPYLILLDLSNQSNSSHWPDAKDLCPSVPDPRYH
jgi:E3 ubiquitin-protein ligase SHPRH